MHELIICPSCLCCEYRELEKSENKIIYWDKETGFEREKIESSEQCIHFLVCKRIEGEQTIKAVD